MIGIVFGLGKKIQKGEKNSSNKKIEPYLNI